MVKNIKYNLVFLFSIITISVYGKKDSNFSIESIDGHVIINLVNENGAISYTLLNKDEVLIASSKISILPNAKTKIESTSLSTENKIWKPVWGQFSEIRNEYKELVLNLLIENIKAKLYVRVFNNGVGFRYELEGYNKDTDVNFYCEYNLKDTDGIYSPNGERSPLGPLTVKALVNAEKQPKLKTPLVIEKSKNLYLSLLESDLFVAPEFRVINFQFFKDKNILVSSNKTKLKGVQKTTPWRVILIEENLGDLVTNTVALNLATPNKIENTSWIKPGKILWDWRVHGYQTKDGFTYGINTESYKRFIDFAAEKNIEYFLIDANWFTKTTKGNFGITDDLDLEKVSNYAKEKEVKLILYYDRKKGNFGDDTLFAHFQSLGMSGIKYGFMGHNVVFTKNAIQKSAESQLIIDFHDGPVPFTGIERTYPNAMTKEYCHAQQDSRRAFTPEDFIKMALINAIQGPLDMNNGNFDITGINKGGRLKGPRKENSYFSTVVSETARTLIIFSGLVCIPDAPEAYAEKADLFEFIQKMPVGKWNESKVLDSKMGEYISTARRHNEEWFVGSVTNKNARTIEIKLDFLKDNKTYSVTYYEDTKNTHGVKNPEAYQIRTSKVNKGDIVKAAMAPGGGHCMWIKPE